MSKTTKNALGVDFSLNSDSFAFVQDKAKIFDQKFETKPTTFLKDAFRRFCKNKSSVVGAIIIGIIILLSIFVPIATPGVGAFDLSCPHPSEVTLKPKLFEAGTGFWDGTEKVEGQDAVMDEDGNYWPTSAAYQNRDAISNLTHSIDADGVVTVSFTYDKYKVLYGDADIQLEQVVFDEYIAKGWVAGTLGETKTYTVDVVFHDDKGELYLPQEHAPEGVDVRGITKGSFEVVKDNAGTETGMEFEYTPYTITYLSDECPIAEIYGVEYKNVKNVPVVDEAGNVTFEDVVFVKPYCKVKQYAKLGYSKAPKFLFGTDELGRDLFSRCFAGMLESLIFALIITTICFLFGLVWGSISGYFGGNVDLLMERFMDILSGVPSVVVVTLFRLHLVDGPEDQLWVFALALCVTGWMGTASRTRTQFYRFKGREYILASRTLGSSDFRLIFKHILPNALGTIVTGAALMIPGIIFTEASYAYLGLGLEGGNSFGSILAANQGALQDDPVLVLFPSAIIAFLMIAFNLFGNGLRDALNPSLKGSE